MGLPAREDLTTCARHGCVSSVADQWYGYLDLHLEITQAVGPEERAELQGVINKLAGRLCWDCLQEATGLLINWMEGNDDARK